MLKTLDGSQRIVVVHTSAEDSGLNEAIVAFGSLSQAGHVSPFFLTQSSPDNQANPRVCAAQRDGMKIPRK